MTQREEPNDQSFNYLAPFIHAAQPKRAFPVNKNLTNAPGRRRTVFSAEIISDARILAIAFDSR
jgi:hypothetical protein